MNKDQVAHLLCVQAGIECAIVEAVGVAQLSVRVPASSVEQVKELFLLSLPVGWTVEVTSLGYAEPFVQGINIFA